MIPSKREKSKVPALPQILFTMEKEQGILMTACTAGGTGSAGIARTDTESASVGSRERRKISMRKNVSLSERGQERASRENC